MKWKTLLVTLILASSLSAEPLSIIEKLSETSRLSAAVWPSFAIQAHPAIPIPPKDAERDFSGSLWIMVHETFHSHQFQAFQISQDKGKPEMADLASEQWALMLLEEGVLSKFLSGPSSQKKKYLLDWLVIRQARLNAMSLSQKAWERDQEIMEGLADYVAAQTLDRHYSKDEGLKRLAARLDQGTFLKGAAWMDRATKKRHYEVGAALGYALDFLNVTDWKSRVENEGISPAEQLIAVLMGENDNRVERLQALITQDSFKAFKERTASEIARYQQWIKGIHKDFQESEGLAFTFAPPPGGPASGRGSVKTMNALLDGTMLIVGDRSELTGAEGKWRLMTNDLPMAFMAASGEKTIKIPSDAKLLLDDQIIALEEIVKNDQKHPFKRLSLVGAGVDFQVEIPGTLTVDHGKCAILF